MEPPFDSVRPTCGECGVVGAWDGQRWRFAHSPATCDQYHREEREEAIYGANDPPFNSAEGWCECGHSTQMHDPIVGCLINECPCTPADTIERLAGDR